MRGREGRKVPAGLGQRGLGGPWGRSGLLTSLPLPPRGSPGAGSAASLLASQAAD